VRSEGSSGESRTDSPSAFRHTPRCRASTDFKQQIRQLESAVVDARTAHQERRMNLLIEREGLPSEVKELIGNQDPDVWWRKFGVAFDN